MSSVHTLIELFIYNFTTNFFSIYNLICEVSNMENVPFSKILLATDGSENSAKAVDASLQLAKSMGASIDIVHVIQAAWGTEVDTDSRTKGEKIVAEIKQKAQSQGIHADDAVIVGNPAEMIINYADRIKVDLIVLGTKGLSGIKKFMLGSVAENVVRHSKRPVMVVP